MRGEPPATLEKLRLPSHRPGMLKKLRFLGAKCWKKVGNRQIPTFAPVFSAKMLEEIWNANPWPAKILK